MPIMRSPYGKVTPRSPGSSGGFGLPVAALLGLAAMLYGSNGSYLYGYIFWLVTLMCLVIEMLVLIFVHRRALRDSTSATPPERAERDVERAVKFELGFRRQRRNALVELRRENLALLHNASSAGCGPERKL